MKKIKYLLLPSLVVLLSIGISASIIKSANAESVTITRACSSGQLQTYTDCETGQQIRRPSMAPGSNRFGSISADGKSFKVLISGGEGIYKVTVNLSNGQNFYVADYPAKGSAVTLTAEAKKMGWTSSGVEIFAPKDIKISSEWVNYIKAGNVFYVNFDTAKFDDSGWLGSGDPMGTLMAGKSYKVQYSAGSTRWTVTGYNEGTKGEYTTAYSTQRPEDYKLNLWGRVYSFNDVGEVTDSDFGPVGHLSKTPNAQITYPIAELGNCKNQADCKLYCSKQENYLVCASYGENKGLISPEDLAKTKEFSDVLKGEGPGACKDQASCESYCNDANHATECVSFAEKHNLLKGEQLAQAKKISNALKQGAVLPGGCKDQTSCETYCKDTSHITECFDFSKKAGLMSADQIAEAEKFLPLIKSGETPGKCKTKEECQSYCDSETNALECVTFAQKAGLATQEEVDIVTKTGGKGPGGCRSKNSCDAYCNEKNNAKECFEFAKKYDLIPADKLKEIEDGMGRLRSGLSQMPSEAIQCLKDALGEGVIGEIESGRFTPGPDAGEIIKGCFDKVLPQLQAKLQEGLKQATPEALTCLKKGLGNDGFEKIQAGDSPSPETGDVIRGCFESMKQEGLKRVREGLGKMPPELKDCIKSKVGSDKISKIESNENVEIGPEIGTMIQDCATSVEGALQQRMEQGMQSAPPEIRDCIQSRLGNIGEKMRTGELEGESDIQNLIQGCVSNFKPSGDGGIPSGVPQGIPPGTQIPEGIPSMPPSTIPSDGGNAPSGGQGVPQVDCSAFSMVPSCSYVPAEAQSICKQCYPNK